MATTIQNIELPKKPRARDTSGNNNHGEIYSGRGLEFDGVSDYLDNGAMQVMSTGAWTVGAWINTNSTSKQYVSSGDTQAVSSNTIALTSSKLAIYAYNDTPQNWRYANTALNLNTWYRALWVYDGAGEVTFYVNGVADGTGSLSLGGDDDDFQTRYVGRGAAGTFLWDGMLADYQAWDAAFTATDAAYDYLNPESLALNASGSALTEGNLKLWYPMQDGHRGQQSYVLDGANTGLGVELVANGDFEELGEGWILGDGWSVGDNEVIKTGATASNLTQYDVFTSGKSYKLTFDISNSNNGRLLVYMGSNSVTEDITNASNVTYTFYGVADGSHMLFRNINFTGSITNISVKAINDKHHATTVFYGDEMVANGDMNAAISAVTIGGVAPTADESTIAISTAITDHTSTDTNNKTIIVTGDDSARYIKINWDDGSDMGFLIGRSYYAECYVYLPASQNVTTVQLKVTDSGGGEIGSQATSATDAWVKLSTTFVADADINRIQVIGISGSVQDLTGDEFYIDSLTVKEVGVASGWTDADQQLHIPQTALQSYNELAWFDGVADHAVVSDHNDLSFDPMSISAWINMNDATDFPIIGKGAYNNNAEYQLKVQSDDKIHFWVADESVDSCHIGRATPTVTTQEKKWIHVVGTYSGGTASSGLKIYINGVQSDDANDESAAASFEAMENLAEDVYIGRYSNTYANGCITETSLWDKELSSTEVLELFNDGKALDALTHSASSDIKGYWRNNGLSTWTDLKGSNNGTPTSVTETILIPEGVDTTRDSQGFLMNKKRSTGSLNLEGTGYEEIGDNDTFDFDAGDFTMECWAKWRFRHTGSVLNTVMGLGGQANGITTASINTDTDEFSFYIGSTNLGSSSTLVDGDWYHVVCTRTSNTMRMYVDGVLEGGTGTSSSQTVTNTASKLIGKDTTTGRHYKNQVDAVKVYNAALSATEVLQNYNATKRDHKN